MATLSGQSFENGLKFATYHPVWPLPDRHVADPSFDLFRDVVRLSLVVDVTQVEVERHISPRVVKLHRLFQSSVVHFCHHVSTNNCTRVTFEVIFLKK